MPQVTMEGVVMDQSKAIARAVAIKNGFYPTDPETMWACDSLVDFNQENCDKILGYLFD